MKIIYPVFFTQTETNVLIEVPDLEILTEGKNLSDAIVMARDTIELKCVSLEDDKMEIPKPSDFSSLDVKNSMFAAEGKTFISLVDANPTKYRRKIDTKTVRRNVALPSWLDYEATQAGVNVSRILQDALMEKLNVHRTI